MRICVLSLCVGHFQRVQRLEESAPKPFSLPSCYAQTLEVKGGSLIDLGGGHELEFIVAPNLHWPVRP